MLGRSLERPPEIVQDRQQLLDEPLVGTRRHCRLLTCAALAEVVELGRKTLQAVEQFDTLSLESAHIRGALLGLRLVGRLLLLRDLMLVGHYAFGASCSSSITS